MDDKKKRYVIPEIEIVDFSNQDIITSSLTNGETLTWGNDDNQEDL